MRLELEWREQLKRGKVEFALWVREGAWRRALQLELRWLVWKSGRRGVTYFLRVTLEAAEIPSQDVALSPRADSAEAQGRKHRCGQAPGQGTEGHAKSQGKGCAVEGNQLHDAVWCDGGGPL